MNELMTQPQSQAQQIASSYGAAVDTAKAVREVEAALMVAKARPRDEDQTLVLINASCKRLGFAEKAVYKYKRGMEMVEGPSIRLAEALARAFGNLDFGWREVERGQGKSTITAYCWDLQTNTKKQLTFEVQHIRETKKGSFALTTERDIYEHIANNASRRVRACILALIPADIIEDAMSRCREAMAAGISTTKQDTSKRLVIAFDELGVSPETLKRFLKVEKIPAATDAQLVELREIYTAIKEGSAHARDFFADEPAVVASSQLDYKKENLNAILAGAPTEVLTKLGPEFITKVNTAASLPEVEKYYSIYQELLRDNSNGSNS